MPNAVVATTTSSAPSMKRSWTSSRSWPLHPRVIGGGVRGTARRPAPRPRAASRRRRSRGPARPRSAPPARAACGSAPCSPWKRSTEKRRFGRSNPRISTSGDRAARAARRSRRAPAAPPSRSARARAGGRAPRSPRRAAGTPAGSRVPTRRCECASSTTNSEMSATRELVEHRRVARAARARGTGTRASPRPARAARARARRRLIVEFSCAAPPAATSRSVSTWSRWSAISGETTTVAPGRQQPGDLVDRRLARAGRHDHQRVASGERGLDRLALPGPQRRDSRTPRAPRARSWIRRPGALG